MKKTEKKSPFLKEKKKIKANRIEVFEGAGDLSLSNPANSENTKAKKKRFSNFFGELIYIFSPGEVVSAAGILKGIIFGALAFIFGRTSLLLDTYPLAIALLSAAEKRVMYIFLGAIASAFTVAESGGVIFSPYVYISSYVMVILIRIIARTFIDPPDSFSLRDIKKKGLKKQLRKLFLAAFEENIYLRMATACVAAFLVSLYAMNEGAYRFYDLFSAMFAMVCAPALTFIFSNLWVEDKDRLGKSLKSFAALSLLTAAVFALREVYFIGIGAAVFLAFGATVYLGMKKGILIGALAGFMTGLAFSPIYAPAFVLGALAAGVVSVSSPVAVSVATGVAMLWGAYIDGFQSLTVLMPALLAASVFVCAIDQLMAYPMLSGIGAKSQSKTDIKIDQAMESPEKRLENLSVTFSEISKALYDISDRLKTPGASEIRSICLRGFETHCKSCPKNDSCHLGDYGSFSEMVSKAGEILGRDGRIKRDHLPSYISDRCIKLERVIVEVNTSFAELIRERVTGEKTELLALDYDGISRILADAVSESKKEYDIDQELTGILQRALSASGMGIKDIAVRGNRKKYIYSSDIGKKAEKMGVKEIREELEKAFGSPLCDPIFELKDGRIAMRTEEAVRYSVESGSSVTAGSGETVCGDCAEIFSGQRDNFYALISDGMGSGQSAAFSSEICGLFLSKMLRYGNKKETSLKMLNTLLRSKGEECSATVDLMEIDLIGGRASFIKSGAAPSFVRRGDKLYKLRSNTAPIGIMRAVDAEQIHFDIEDGDIMIMLSDGISQTPEECFWLMEMLGEEWDKDESLDSIAKRITSRAAAEGSRDDASVLLLRINKIQKEAV